MKKSLTILFTLIMVFAIKSETASPLELVRTIPMPGIAGRFDSFGVDVKGRRLFVTPLDHKTVEVYDLKTGNLIHSIPGIEKAHAVLYRGDLDEIFVTDGPAGSLKIFKGDKYEFVRAVEPLAAPDGVLYDQATHYLYIITGGENAKLDYSLIAIVDTDKAKNLGDIRIEGGTMEEMRLGKLPVGLAIDESSHRLFVGCRSEVMVVVDSASGKEITSVPISNGIDGMTFDPATKRIYSEANTGAIDVYEEVDADHYRSLGTTPIGTPAKPGLLVPELKRYFVAAPNHDKADAAILEYKTQ